MNPASRPPASLSDVVDIRDTLVPALAYHEQTSRKTQNSLLVLIVTVMLFFSSRIVSADFLHVAILVGVLFFHELGHFIMMKALKYNDVRMFFIPFFGAAVSGKPKNNSTLKSCLVSFMGPFPGILLGVACFFLFGLTHRYAFLKATEMLLFLNLFNLLPIVPFDGGRFLETLFIDNFVARSIYAVFSVLFLAAIALLLEDILFLVIAALSLWAFIGNGKVWRLGVALKKKGLRASSVGELAADPDAMEAVATSLYSAKPKAFHPSLDVKAVYESLETILDIASFKSLRAVFKALLFLVYAFVFLASLAFFALFAFIGYREAETTKVEGGVSVAICRSYAYDKLNSEIPVDSDGLYDGKGVVYDLAAEDGQKVESEFYYASGFRTGVWTDYDDAGNPVKREEYQNGALVSESRYADGAWTTIPYADLSPGRKLKERVRKASQPRKSLAPRFEE